MKGWLAGIKTGVLNLKKNAKLVQKFLDNGLSAEKMEGGLGKGWHEPFSDPDGLFSVPASLMSALPPGQRGIFLRNVRRFMKKISCQSDNSSDWLSHLSISKLKK